MVMEESSSPQRIGRKFVEQYYELLNKAPVHLHRFYNNYSTFVHGDLDAPNRETLPVIGQKQIQNRIQQLNFHDCHAKISQVDAQATLGNGVVVQVTGEFSNGGAPMRRFTQTFVLVAQSPNKYYVHNNIFRYQETLTPRGEHKRPRLDQSNRVDQRSYAQAASGTLDVGITCDCKDVSYQMRVTDTETELVALAAERIQEQAEQSSEVINSLQEQLERVKIQLQTVETDRNTLLVDICAPQHSCEGTSKEMVLNEIGKLMESELQCSICSELFLEPTTLNCSHTFCKYCISIWKKTKRDCPVCRASITSECKSLVLESFIEKMVQSLSVEMQQKRKEILRSRKGL